MKNRTLRDQVPTYCGLTLTLAVILILTLIGWDQVPTWGGLRNWKLDLRQPSATFVDHRLVDAQGYHYQFDFPFIAPGRIARRHRFVYGVAPYAKNSTRYEDWALVKIDTDQTGQPGQPSVQPWFENAHYPSEPIFVPHPNASAEDDGVLLSQVLDGMPNPNPNPHPHPHPHPVTGP